MIVIHNANMPLVTVDHISECINKCESGEVVVTTAKCFENLYQVDDGGTLSIGPDRNSLLQALAPEAMHLDTANVIYENTSFSDKKYESYSAGMLAISMGLTVRPVICGSTNMKITTREDYQLVKIYLQNESSATVLGTE